MPLPVLRGALVLIVGVLASGMPVAEAQQTQPASPASTMPLADATIVPQIKSDAKSLEPMAASPLAKQFLAAAQQLPSIEPRTIFYDPTAKQFLTAEQAAALPEETRTSLKERRLDEKWFYYTRYGTPLAYLRPVDLIGKAGIDSFQGTKLLDLGYGGIGHLRMMASQGAHVFGVEVDPLLQTLYSAPGDQGEIKNIQGKPGSITLIQGRLNEPLVVEQLGGGYDIIISKNTLKRGYIHPPPDQKVDPRQLVDLGLDDQAFLKRCFDMLKPGGLVMIYNLSPKQANLAAGERYIPWADGRSPFERQLIEQVGFEVIEFDAEDSEMARRMGSAFGWDKQNPPMDLQNDLHGHYTLFRKPAPGP